MNKFKMRVKKRLTDELARIKSFSSDFYKGEREGINFALYTIDSIDGPEKPVLTETEAEWVDRLTDFYSLPDALYYITRCGYGDLFTFTIANKTYELPVDSDITYGELCKLKERLMNAVIYGYEVKKEKLYTVEIPNPNDFVHTILHRNEKGIIISYSADENYKNIKQNQLTEAEIKKDFEWAWQFKEEVEE